MNNSFYYHPLLRVLHWLMALLILTMIGVGWYMTGLAKDDALRGTLYGLHKSTGVLVLMLLVVRLAVRMETTVPPLPTGIPGWEKRLADITHHVFYLFFFLVPMSGIWMSNSWGHGVSFYGLFEFSFFPANQAIAPRSSETHEIMAFTLLGLIVLHVVGVIKHRFIDGHDVLYRMTGTLPRKNP